MSDPARQVRIPKSLPIYIFRGSSDPVGSNIDQLLNAYRAAALQHVAYKVYPDGRHEMLNETIRDEVTQELDRLARRGDSVPTGMTTLP